MLTEIISVGDELLAGISVNSNAAYIGEKLAELGYEVRWITTVGDDEEDLMEALKQAYDRASVVILTGGLGPTHDDITKVVVSRFFDSKIVFRQDILTKIEARFRKMGREMSATNRVQAEVPEKAEIIENRAGTAPGLIFKKDDRTFYVLPGVPSEMKRMLEKSVIPGLRGKSSGRIVRSRTLRTVGMLESDLYQLLEGVIDRFSDMKISFLPQTPGVAIRLVVTDPSSDACEEQLARVEAVIREKAGEFVFGADEDTVESVLSSILLKRGLTIAVAESCTGGLISHKLTNIPGSSRTMGLRKD